MPGQVPNPLLSLHQQKPEVEFQTWADITIVQTFGLPQAEYAALRKSAGLIDLPQRGILELTGKDRLPFLNNLLTNQTWNKATKSGLSAGQGVYAFILNLRGRIVADMNVLELGDRTLIETEARLVEPLHQLFEKYLFGEVVKVVSRIGQLHEIALHGPQAGMVLGVSLDSPLQCVVAKLGQADVVIWRDDPTGSPGYYAIVPAESAADIWKSLVGEPVSIRPVGWAAFNSARIEGGRPIFAIDFDGASVASAVPGKHAAPADDGAVGTLPAETGLFDRAVSVTKGCYLGQEIVARMHARGQIARQLVGVRVEGDALPIAGAEVFDEQSNIIGIVTSSTMTPMLSNAPICLAIVKRPHFSVGTKLRIPAEGAIRAASVVDLPFLKQQTSP